MQLKYFLYKLFFFVFIFFICNSYVFSVSIDKKSENILMDDANSLTLNLSNNFIKKNIFFKKPRCFSFFKFHKNYFSKQSKIVISNNNLIGFFENKRFKIFYIVNSGDTIYSISKNFGYDYYQLSKFNSIKKPYKIIVGQKIWIGDFLLNEKKYNCSIINIDKKNQKNYYSCKSIFNSPLKILNFLKKNIQSAKICFSCDKDLYKYSMISNDQSFVFSDNWYWPIKSKKIKYFYSSQLYNKKIEISGYKGQPVFSAAAGEVVYISDSFKKYGKLIIIKHNNYYLSVYAFNSSILVKQKDKVYQQQQIATMGFSEQHLARLYFEIRYKGNPINPLNILPKINIKK